MASTGTGRSRTGTGGSSRRGFVTAHSASAAPMGPGCKRRPSSAARHGVYVAGVLLLLAIALARGWLRDSTPQPPPQGQDTIRRASSSSPGAAAAIASAPAGGAQPLARESESSCPQPPARGSDFRALMECFDDGSRHNLDDPQVRAMARSLDAGIDDALAARDVDPGEALRLKADILDVLEVNPVARGNALVAWLHAQPSFQVPLGEPGDTPVEDYRRGEATLVAAWQLRRPDERDPEDLANQLDRLMREALQLPAD